MTSGEHSTWPSEALAKDGRGANDSCNAEVLCKYLAAVGHHQPRATPKATVCGGFGLILSCFWMAKYYFVYMHVFVDTRALAPS